MSTHFHPASPEISHQANYEQRLIRLLKKHVSQARGFAGAPWFVAGLLAATSSRRLRNAAALALVDMGATEAGRTIIESLRNPDLAHEAGTLLYALDELGLTLPIDVLLVIVEHGSYEARATAISMLEHGRLDGGDASKLAIAQAKLTEWAGGNDLERAETARLSLDLLSERPAI